MANSKRKCKGCNRYLRQDRHDWRNSPAGWFHTLDCQVNYARKKVEFDRVEKQKIAKKELKQKVKGKSHYEGLTQTVINGYARRRDKFERCISCFRHDHEIKEHHTGGKVDAGHFLTVGGHPEMRFDLRNINKQCKWCNRDKDGNIAGQKVGIVNRFGQARLDWLEEPHEAKHYSIDYLARMRKVIRRRAFRKYGVRL